MSENCYKYYYCVDNNDTLNSYTVECLIGAPFAPQCPHDRKCEVGGKCVTVNCTGNVGPVSRSLNYTDFTKDRLAVKCKNGAHTKVNLCPGGLSLDLTDPSTAKCELKCVFNYQMAVHTSMKDMFFICLLGKAYLRMCKDGYEFDPEALDCVKS